VEVFGYVSFGPDFLDAIFFKYDALEGFPSEEGVMADELWTVSLVLSKRGPLTDGQSPWPTVNAMAV